jgi:cell division septation protein DedD
MLCAFYLGLVSGQKAGFETAQAINLASVAKLPVPDQYREEDLEAVANEVYAKLGSGKEKAPSIQEESKPKEPVDLTPITTKKVTKPEPIKEKELDVIEAEIEAKSEAKNRDIIRILSEPPTAKKSVDSRDKTDVIKKKETTLGALIKEEEEEEEEQELESVETAEPSSEKSVLASLGDAKIEAKKTANVVAPKKEEQPAATVKTAPEAAKIEPKKVENKPKEVAPAERASNVAKGWYAQVAAPSRREDALVITQKLKESGFRAVIETANIRGESYYRVLVGPEEEKRSAKTRALPEECSILKIYQIVLVSVKIRKRCPLRGLITI